MKEALREDVIHGIRVLSSYSFLFPCDFMRRFFGFEPTAAAQVPVLNLCFRLPAENLLLSGLGHATRLWSAAGIGEACTRRRTITGKALTISSNVRRFRVHSRLFGNVGSMHRSKIKISNSHSSRTGTFYVTQSHVVKFSFSKPTCPFQISDEVLIPKQHANNVDLETKSTHTIRENLKDYFPSLCGRKTISLQMNWFGKVRTSLTRKKK